MLLSMAKSVQQAGISPPDDYTARRSLFPESSAQTETQPRLWSETRTVSIGKGNVVTELLHTLSADVFELRVYGGHSGS